MFHVFALIMSSTTRVEVSRWPEEAWAFTDSLEPCDLAVLTPPIPISHAYFIANQLRKSIFERPARTELERRRLAVHGFRRASRTMRALGSPGSGLLPTALYLKSSQAAISVAEPVVREILEHCAASICGRVLLDEEALRACAAAGMCSILEAPKLISTACALGYAKMLPAVGIGEAGGFVCNRCGARTGIVQVPCSRCGRSECAMCVECRSMGAARECLALFIGPEVACTPVAAEVHVQDPMYNYSLTEVQKQALEECVRWYREPGGSQELLVWAVCGAGKSEVAFGTIAEALRQGRQAAFAVPRRDVAAEIQPRLASAFPALEPAAFYGGSSRRNHDSNVTVLTCHQAMRFSGRFHLIVLDEADAFPYFGSESLASSLRRALAPGGRILVMTATPSAGHLARVRSGTMPVVRISARHHGRALPVPEVVCCSDIREAAVSEVRSSVDSGWPVFVFAPGRKSCEQLAALLKSRLSSCTVDWIHSHRADRDAVRERFARRAIDVLVATSVMERGITVEGADVVIAGADCVRIFDHRALVQMAGRAGRWTGRPEGRVSYICTRRTPAMTMAVSMIKEMNADARVRGFISD